MESTELGSGSEMLDRLNTRKEWFTIQSPIGVIGAFAAVVEVAMILAAIFVDGNARWALIGFAGIAFFYIATWFFWILTHQAWVLYPPKEYGGETGVLTYVDALSPQRKQTSHSSLSISVEPESESVAISSTVSKTLTLQPSESTSNSGSGFMVYMGERRPDSLGLFVESGSFFHITDCLSFIGNSLLPSFETEDEVEKERRHVFNYGTSWILRNAETKKEFREIGTKWARKVAGTLYDVRPLEETTLVENSHLELIRLEPESLPVATLLADRESLLRKDGD